MRAHHKQSFPLDLHRFDLRHIGSFPALVAHRTIGQIGFAIVGGFFPIFIYEFVSQNLTVMLLWFAVAYVMRIPLFILAAKVFSRTGLRISMVIGVVMWIVYYIASALLDIGVSVPTNVLLLVSFFALALFHSFYWAPFHVDFATFSQKGRRGRAVSATHIFQGLVNVSMPVIAALLITQFSYKGIFIVGIFAGVLSLIPLFSLPKTEVNYEFGFLETFRVLFSRKFLYLSFSMMARGAESAISYIAWPVFLFIVFDRAYLDVGLFAAIIFLISMTLQWVMGNLVDHQTPKRFLGWGARVYSLGWFVKALVDSVVGVFAASTFHSFGAILLRTPMEAMMYEQAADSGHYIDEYTVIREISLTIGRAGAVLLMAFLVLHFPLSSAFVVAGLASVFVSLLAKFISGEAFGV